MTELEIILSIAGLIIGAISLLFAIFTAAIAFIAIIEWRSYKDFQRKKKEAEVQYKKIISELITEKEKFRKETKIILGESKKVKNKRNTAEQEKKLSELFDRMNKAIERTEGKLVNLESTGFTLSASPFTSTTFGSTLGTTTTSNVFTTGSASLLLKNCVRCGSLYHSPITSLDNGMCEKCNEGGIYGSATILNK